MIVLASRTGAVRRRWRAGLRRFTVQDAPDSRRLEALLAQRAPAVVFVDAAIFGARGAGDVATLQRLSPATRFIIASDEPAEQEGLAAFRAGARGYCHRDLDPALLVKAVEVVQKGEIWAGRTLVARLVEELGARQGRARKSAEGARLGSLTRRERDIAGLVASGAANKEIAHRLGVTERTVKAHLTAVFRKLGVNDRLRLALYLNGAVPIAADGLAPKSNLRNGVGRDQ
jgi:two-component system nitrate/nitrite response regulator NarL